MADARHQGQNAEPHGSGEAAADASARQGAFEATRRESERLAAQAREGSGQARAAAALRSGSEMTQGVQDIAAAWARYGEEVMRQTAEASRALINCHSFSEMFEVQARLLRGNLQAFLDQSSKIADIAGQMAARPAAALRQTGTEQDGH